MTKDYEAKLRREFELRRSRVSEESAMCVLNAIERWSATCRGVGSKNFIGEIKGRSFAVGRDVDAYDWLKRNGIADLTPAICAGARRISAIAAWLIKKGALSLAEELKEAVE